MIRGVGIDLVEIRRITASLERFGERFAQRVLAPEELPEFARATQRSHFLAKRFAAKEAFVKAMGTGFRHGLSLRQIAVRHEAGGRPTLHCTGRADELLGELGIGPAHLTLSDEREFAVACVVLEARTD